MSHALAGKRNTPESRAYRFDAGRTMTDFVLHSAEAAAERTIQERAMLILSARETEVFVDAMLNPAEPGSVLRAAARHYKNSVGR